MSQIFVREIDKLKKHLVCMFRLVERNYFIAVRSLAENDQKLADKVFAGENEIDDKKIDIQEECFKILALHQPVAFDLRFIMATWKFNNDLERIGDLAVGIAARSRALASLPLCPPPFDVALMADLVHAMLTRSLDALINLDIQLASEVLADEEEVDVLHRSNLKLVKERILVDNSQIDALINYLSVSRYLERIGDLITNLGEEVIYIVEGNIVNHQYHDEDPTG